MRYLLVLVLATASACSSKKAEAPAERSVRIAAAADLSKAFTEIAAEFKTRTGIAANLEFGSSGLLAKQIEQGAPFSMFAAANRDFVDQVIKAGKCDGATAHSYARGRIVVFTPGGVDRPATLNELADPKYKKIAIANPEHAPYGRAAKQALEKTGVWPQIQDRIVLGENIQATMLYARDHNADVAIVALSLAIQSDGGVYLPIDPDLYAPLDQAMVVCGTGDGAAAAKQFADFVSSKEGREVMTRYGFLLPGEQSPVQAAAKPVAGKNP
jgi:molybdate transport system substrate-binding protein